MEVNGYLTTALVLLMMSSAVPVVTIPTEIDLDDPVEREATRITFMRRRAYFAMVTALMLGGAIASWQGNETWTMYLGGASLASVLVYALGIHTML
jgi:hypothetical protein